MAEGSAETIITWNVPNWITVLIMVTAGFFIIATASQMWQKWRGNKGGLSAATAAAASAQ
jgi:hypothetical protein